METKTEIFPSNITLLECYESIKDFPGFRVSEKLDLVIFNYDFAFRQSFPDPMLEETEKMRRLMSIRRECRGIIFHKETGNLVARRLHKFFNINEMDETKAERIDLSKPHILLTKADGCLVTPFMCEGKLRFGTKLGVTEVSKTIENDFLPNHPESDYFGFSEYWINKGYTPMFELCASKHQVILEYPEDVMYLIAVRNNATGNYLPWPQLEEAAAERNIPIVSPLKELVYETHYYTAEDLLQIVRKMNGVEGLILLFEDGSMYKAKTDYYIQRSKKATTAEFHEKDIWEMLLNGTIDDFAEFFGPKRHEQIGLFGFELFSAIQKTAEKVTSIVNKMKEENENMEKKDFVRLLINLKKSPDSDPLYQFDKLFFCAFDGGNVEAEVKKLVLYNTASAKKLEHIRNPICGGISISLNS